MNSYAYIAASAWCRTTHNHTMEAPVTSKNGTAIWFINTQPLSVNKSPDDSELAAIVMKISVSFTPCAFARSDGV